MLMQMQSSLVSGDSFGDVFADDALDADLLPEHIIVMLLFVICCCKTSRL